MEQNKKKRIQIEDLKVKNIALKEVAYHKNDKKIKDDDMLMIKDELSNLQINDYNISVDMSRRIIFNEVILVRFNVEFECLKPINEQEFKEIVINEDAPYLPGIYRLISLVISNLTVYTDYGTLVTIPTFNFENRN